MKTAVNNSKKASFGSNREHRDQIEMILRELRESFLYHINSSIKISKVGFSNIKIGNHSYSGISIQLEEGKSGMFNGIVTSNSIALKEDQLMVGNICIGTKKIEDLSYLINFITGREKNIYGKFSNKKTLAGKSFDFETITQKIEELRVRLQETGYYNKLTRKEKFLIDLPIVHWKNGWSYASIFIFNWFVTDNRILKFNDFNFFDNTPWFKKHLDDALKDLSSNNNSKIYVREKQKNNLKNLYKEVKTIETGWVKYVGIGDDYKKGGGKTYFASAPVSKEMVKENVNTDLAGSFGQCSPLFYFSGSVYKDSPSQATITIEHFHYRMVDSFDFKPLESDGIRNFAANIVYGDQPLGDWSFSVFRTETPKAGGMVTNESFRNLRSKIYRGKDFDVHTPYKIISLPWKTIELYNIDKYEKLNDEELVKSVKFLT